MARVTVEDCVDKVPNRFDLVLLASHRARQVSQGGQITIDRDNDKNPVVALREIADATVPLAALQESLIRGLQRHVENDEPEEDKEMSVTDQVWTEAIQSRSAEAEVADAGLEVDEGAEGAVAEEE